MKRKCKVEKMSVEELLRVKRLHGNCRIRNFLTGEYDRTAGDLRRAAAESAKNFLKTFAVKEI